MIWIRKRLDNRDDPQPLTWGDRLRLLLQAVLILAMITTLVTFSIRASWWTVAGFIALATGGACILLLLYLLRIADPSEARQRQFSMRVVLLAMVGLGMMLAGLGGIFRLVRTDPTQSTPRDWLGLIFAFAIIFTLGTPILAVLLETLMPLANSAIRWPVVRWLFRPRKRSPQESRPS